MVEAGDLRSRGLAASVCLREAFDPHGSEITDLRAAGVSEQRISALYPFDFGAYLPALEALLQGRSLAQQVVEGSRSTRQLSASRLALAGYHSDGLDRHCEDFTQPHTRAMDRLYEVTLVAYTENFKRLPKPAFSDRSKLDQACAEVQELMDNLALSAYLLANWDPPCNREEQIIVDYLRLMQEGEELSRVWEAALNIFNKVWKPLMVAKVGLLPIA